MPSFLPFLALGEGSHSKCWFVLLPPCIPYALEPRAFSRCTHGCQIWQYVIWGPSCWLNEYFFFLRAKKSTQRGNEGSRQTSPDVDMCGLWISAPRRNAYHGKDCSSEGGVASNRSFACNTPNSPGPSRDHGCLKEHWYYGP